MKEIEDWTNSDHLGNQGRTLFDLIDNDAELIKIWKGFATRDDKGRLHSIADQPAVHYQIGNDEYKAWYNHGKRHRIQKLQPEINDNNFAIKYGDNYQWWVDGKWIATKENHDEHIIRLIPHPRNDPRSKPKNNPDDAPIFMLYMTDGTKEYRSAVEEFLKRT